MILVKEQIFAGIKILLILLHLYVFVICLIGPNVFESKKLFPRSPDRGIGHFYLFSLMIVKSIDHVKEASLTHFKYLAVGCLAEFAQQYGYFGDEGVFEVEAVGVNQ